VRSDVVLDANKHGPQFAWLHLLPIGLNQFPSTRSLHVDSTAHLLQVQVRVRAYDLDNPCEIIVSEVTARFANRLM
jgi:hypothetical protein